MDRFCWIPRRSRTGGGGRSRTPGGEQAAFAFFTGHYGELARFAYLLTGEHDAAEALAQAWKHRNRISFADRPLTYVRRIVANLAADPYGEPGP
ncbi:RNA polymerase sigma factor [Actinomadura kijaniata]|uniref:RNA polymerase sigma factor n=1 Tax=Actinomadura kijaniata TaxID=46161 RepID=UPI00082A9E2B|nr:hypothetical protein [Actinomadura kijaniata]